jgi:hypothetical protein
MIEERRGDRRIFGRFVPAPHGYGCPSVQLACECTSFSFRKWTALECQRIHRCLGQSRNVVWLDSTQIALCHHVEPDGFGDLFREPLREPPGAGVLVPLICSFGLTPADRLKVTHIVQQGGSHQVIGSPGAFGERRSLQHVRRKADFLTQVTSQTLARKQPPKEIDRR